MAEITAKSTSPISSASPVAVSLPASSVAPAEAPESDAPETTEPVYSETPGFTDDEGVFHPESPAEYYRQLLAAQRSGDGSGGGGSGAPPSPPELEAPVIPDFSTPPETEEEREQLLQEAVEPETVSRIARGLEIEGIGSADYLRSVEDIKGKLSLAEQVKAAEKSWKESGQEPPPEVVAQLQQSKALVYGKIAPFVDLERQTIDVPGALRAGVPEEQILAAGVSEDVVKRASAENFIQKRYKGDPLKAIEGGDIEAVRALGIAPNRDTANVPVKDWKKLSYDEQVGLTILGMQSGVMDTREWERTVLPTLPPEGQTAYRTWRQTGKGTDWKAWTKSVEVSQQEFERWINSDEAPAGAKKAWGEGGLDGYNAWQAGYRAEIATAVSGLEKHRIPGSGNYDWAAAVRAGDITPDQMRLLGVDESFISATQSYATQVQGLIDKFNQGVEPRGTGLSRGLGITGAESFDLGTAIREAGLKIKGGSPEYTWRSLTDEQKYRVANVLAGYSELGGVLPSVYRSFQSMALDEKLGFVPKLGMTMTTAPVMAIITPFVKDMTVGELKQKIDPYAKTNAKGKITDYDLTKYLKDNPYDAPLLARGGFSADDIEKAQEGKQVKAMPQGATPLDWAIAGVMVASVALPVLKSGAMAAGTRLIQPVMSPGLRLGTMAIMQNIYRGAALGEQAIKWGLPVGMTSYDVANWSKMTPEQRAVAGVFTGLTYIPVLGSLYRAGRSAWTAATTASAKGGILPRGLTTGYQDVYAVRPPPDFFAGVSGDTPTALMKIINTTKSPKAIPQVAALLEPTIVAPAFTQAAQMAMDVSKFSIPSSQFVSAETALGAVPGMTPRAASALAKWLSEHPDVYVKGSTAMVAQGRPLSPNDLDLHTTGDPNNIKRVNVMVDPTTLSSAQIAKYRAYADSLKTQLASLLERNGARIQHKKGDGGVGIDISYPGKRFGSDRGSYRLPALPYGWENLVPSPTVIGGVKFQPIGEQVLRLAHTSIAPGVGASRGLMGSKVETLPPGSFPAGELGTFSGRAKDARKFEDVVKYVIDYLKASGDTTRASKLQGYLDTFRSYQTRLADGSVKPLSPEETQDLQKVFLEAVSEVQYATLAQGGNAMLVDPSTGLVVSKIVSPAGEVLPGTVYFASRDLTADIAMLKMKGSWGPTQRQVFFSPEAAYDFLINRETGELGKNAGIIAVRTDPSVDMGPNGIITGPFRYEKIDGKEIIYNELVSEGEFYATDPNARALSKDGVSGGVTGESVTYYPRTKTKVPILWTATKAARMDGLGAPSETEMQEINSMAWKQSILDLLHPHWSDVTLSEPPAQIRANLIEFYRNTYKTKKLTPAELDALMKFYGDAFNVKQLSPEKLGELIKTNAQKTLNEAVASLKARGVEPTEANIHSEVANIYHNRQSAVVKDIYKALGVRLPVDIIAAISASGVRGAATPVEDITGMLEALDPATREAVVKGAESAYDAAIQQLSPEAVAALTDSTKAKRLYYLNLGKISTKLAALATTASILTATAPAIANTLVPATRIPTTETVPTISTLPTPRTTPTVPTVPTTPTTLPPTTVTGITTPTVPTTPTTPTTPTEPTTPTTPTIPTTPTTTTTPTTPVTPTPTPKPKPPKPKPTVIIRLRSDGSKEAELPEGSIAWKQGLFWKWIAPTDVTQVSGVRKPRNLPKGVIPVGARFTDQRTPAQTVQMIGDSGASAPDVSVDLGVADIRITDNAQAITYTGKGEQTNVGKTIDMPTQGMTIGEAEVKGHAYARQIYPKHSVSRTDMDTEVQTPIREMRGKDRVGITEQTESILDDAYEEPAPKPVPAKLPPKREDDISDLVSLTEEDLDELSGVSEADIWGEEPERPKKVSKNRVRQKRTQPIRGRDNPIMLGRIRL